MSDLLPLPAQASPAAPAAARSSGSGHRLLLLGGLLMLWVLGGLLTVAYQAHERQMQEARTNNLLLARLFADHVTRNIDAASLAGATLAELLLGGAQPQSAEFNAALRQTLVNLPFLRGLAVVDTHGLVLTSTDAAERGRVLDLNALGPLPQSGQDTLGPYVQTRGLLNPAMGLQQPPVPPGAGFLPLMRRVSMANGSEMWLLALINASAFTNFQQATLGDDPQRASALLSFDGQLVGSTGSVAHALGADLSDRAPFTRFLPLLEHGDWTGPGLQEGTQVAAFRASATRPLVVMVEEARAAVQRRWLAELRGLALAGVVAAAVIIVMSLIALSSERARASAQLERDQAQQAVARRERELSVTLKSLQELIFRTDTEGRLSFVNERWTSFTGQAVAQASSALWQAFTPESCDQVRHLFSADEQGGLRRTQAVLRGRDRQLHWVEIAVVPLQHAGRLVGFAGSAVDVSARVHAQRQLQEQLAFTEQMMEVSPLPMSVMTSSGRYVLVNRAWETFTGLNRARVVGTTVGGHLSPKERAVHEAQDAQLVASGLPVRYETTAHHSDGTVRDVVINKLLLPTESGQPGRIMSVLVDVTEFRHAERATREARDAAEEASRSKSEFIANISHELRTPLQTIIGFSELGQMRGREQPKLAAMFEDIHGAGQRMLNLVNDLLDVAKIESSVGTIHLERTDLRGLLHGVVRELEPLLAPKRLRVALQLPDWPLTARVDPGRFQQVVRNVLANAVKFSPEAGVIGLGGDTSDAGEPRIWVRDNGPGIPEAELESIFEAFVQSSRTRDGSGGTGLGLAITRAIVQAHGGCIQARNHSEGGAEFMVRLPARGQSETLPAPL